MSTNVRGYSDEELLNRVKSLDSFKGIPKGYWILGVRSQEDEHNVYDDKFYVFHGEDFIMVTTGTTNPGASSLANYTSYNSEGSAIVKSDEWYQDLWTFGLHKGKMQALRQLSPIKYYRDGNKDRKSEEVGKLYEGIIYINFHTSSYTQTEGSGKTIGGWSAGCQVCNQYEDYYRIIGLVKYQHTVTYCLIKEF